MYRTDLDESSEELLVARRAATAARVLEIKVKAVEAILAQEGNGGLNECLASL